MVNGKVASVLALDVDEWLALCAIHFTP